MTIFSDGKIVSLSMKDIVDGLTWSKQESKENLWQISFENFCGFFRGKMTNWKLQNEWLFSLVHSFFASRIKQKLRLKSAAKSLKSLRQNIDWKRSQHFSWVMTLRCVFIFAVANEINDVNIQSKDWKWTKREQKWDIKQKWKSKKWMLPTDDFIDFVSC